MLFWLAVLLFFMSKDAILLRCLTLWSLSIFILNELIIANPLLIWSTMIVSMTLRSSVPWYQVAVNWMYFLALGSGMTKNRLCRSIRGFSEDYSYLPLLIHVSTQSSTEFSLAERFTKGTCFNVRYICYLICRKKQWGYYFSNCNFSAIYNYMAAACTVHEIMYHKQLDELQNLLL